MREGAVSRAMALATVVWYYCGETCLLIIHKTQNEVMKISFLRFDVSIFFKRHLSIT